MASPHDAPTDSEAPPRYEKHNQDPKPDLLPTTSSPSSSCTPQTRPNPPKNTKSFLSRLLSPLSSPRNRHEARTSVMSTIQHTLHDPYATSEDWARLLKTSEATCAAASLSLAYLLQEHFIEEHTPLYWAVLKREGADADPELFDLLMEAAAPLTEPTVVDIYAACIVTSDQPLFQRLRSMSGPGSSLGRSVLSGTDRLLLARTPERTAGDKVTVEDVPGVNGTFLATFEIVLFQQRMRVAGEIGVDFIARGRMWRLSFFVSTREIGRRARGSWCMSLCLLNQSPPTFLDGKFIVEEHTSTRSSSLVNQSKSSIVIPCRAFAQLFSTTSSKHNALLVAFEDSPIGSSVQYKGTTFIAPDETLRLTLYARLCKPPGRDPNAHEECVIC